MKAKRSLLRLFLPLAVSSLCAFCVQAQDNPTLVSSVPANGATGVSPATQAVFTFSKSMATEFTSVIFIDPTAPLTPITTIEDWNGPTTVLTVSFPAGLGSGKMIFWSVAGEDLDGNPLDPEAFGSFQTGTGGGGTGTGTNAITSFVVGKVYFYNQTNASAPTLDPEFPYAFQAITSFASNRTAQTLTLTLPTGSVKTLAPVILGPPEDWTFHDFTTSLATFDATYPSGNYTFNLTGSSPNDPVTLALPAGMVQPNAPNINNLPGLQSIDPAKPTTVAWQAFQNGTANDFIQLGVNGDTGTVFQTASLNVAGALPGTATSVVIPANTLTANTAYTATVAFYRYTLATNSIDSRSVYRATLTEFEIKTTSGGSTGDILLSTPKVEGTTITLDVLNTSPGQIITLETRPTVQGGTWVTRETKTAAGTTVSFTDNIESGGAKLYRARTGG